MEKQRLRLRFLDHVAIRAADMDRSAKWYEEVLDMKPYRMKEWGPFPIFMLAGQFGVAIFPAKTGKGENSGNPPPVFIDHFAFNVDRPNFELARQRYSELGLDFSVQDHHYFESIYTTDPDGHKVELTTLIVAAEDFY